MDSEKKTFFQGVSPKFTFAFGLIIGVAIISTVAFFVVLVNSMGGESASAGNDIAKVADEAAIDAFDDFEEVVTVDSADIDLSNVHVRGDENAPVTIVVYSDIECPYSARFHETMNQIMADYGSDVKWAWKHYPLSFHPEAEPAANAAECAGEQNKFWEYLDGLYVNQASLDSGLYPQLAADLGLNISSFNTCLTANKYSDLFVADFTEGSQIGVAGTPGSVVFKDGAATGEIIAGAYPYEYIAERIDGLL